MISGDEHTAARLGLMGPGLGPAQTLPPRERVCGHEGCRAEGLGGGVGGRGEGEIG